MLAIPAFSIHTATPGTDTLPQNLSVVKTYNKVQKAFPGGPIPAVVAVSAANVTSPQVAGAISDLRKQAAANPLFKQPITTTINPDRTVAEIDIPLAGDGSDSQSRAALAQLRNAGPSDDRADPERHGGRGRLHRRLEGLQRHHEVARCRSSSASSSRRPSCCCWSRSARW